MSLPVLGLSSTTFGRFEVAVAQIPEKSGLPSGEPWCRRGHVHGAVGLTRDAARRIAEPLSGCRTGRERGGEQRDRGDVASARSRRSVAGARATSRKNTEHGHFPRVIDGATPIDPTATYTKSVITGRRIQPNLEPKARATAIGTRLGSASPLQRARGRSRCVPRGPRAHNDATKTKGGAALRANVGSDNLVARFHPFFG